MLCHWHSSPLVFIVRSLTLIFRQTLTSPIGAFLVLLEIVTFRSRPKNILNPSKLSERVFGKLWLRIGMSVDKTTLRLSSLSDLDHFQTRRLRRQSSRQMSPISSQKLTARFSKLALVAALSCHVMTFPRLSGSTVSSRMLTYTMHCGARLRNKV